MFYHYSQLIPSVPPDSFYYTLFLLLGTVLIWIIKVYISRTDATLKQLVETVARLDKIIGIHEVKHQRSEEAIRDIRGRKGK